MVTRSLGEKLARCAGYSVRSAAGESIGRVAWVRYETRADCPDTLVVRVGRVVTSRDRLKHIPTDRVDQIDVPAQTVTLAKLDESAPASRTPADEL